MFTIVTSIRAMNSPIIVTAKIGHLWGVRNLSLAAGMFAATGANRAQWWRLQVAVDALDFVAIATEWRRGAVPGPAAALMAATALGATTLGALSVAGESGELGWRSRLGR